MKRGLLLLLVMAVPHQPLLAQNVPGDERAWINADYMLFWMKQGPLAGPLVSTSAPVDVGALGTPTTTVLFGGSGLNHGTFSGLRTTAGAWFDDDGTVGFEGTGFLLEQRSAIYSVQSDAAGDPLLAIPAFDPTSGLPGPFVTLPPGSAPPAEAGLFITQPGNFAGGMEVQSSSRFWNAEVNGLLNIYRGERATVDGLLGYRYLDLSEDLSVRTNSLGLAGSGSFAGTSFFTADRFQTRNQFHGGQLGLRGTVRRGLLDCRLAGKIALGSMHEVVNRNGISSIVGSSSTATPSGAFPAGILVVPTNAGRLSSDRFAVIPDIELQIGIHLRERLRAFIGYQFLYVSEVARPGQQMDRAVNLSQVPVFGGTSLVGPARPSPLFETTDFWIQGLHFGVEWCY